MKLIIDFNICLIAWFLSKSVPETIWVIKSDNITFFCSWIYIREGKSKWHCQHAAFTCFSMLMHGIFTNIFCLLVMDMQD